MHALRNLRLLPIALACALTVALPGPVVAAGPVGGTIAAPAAEQLNQLVATLQRSGYRIVDIRRTFLGRFRIRAENGVHLREIVVSRSTGEIMHDAIIRVFATKPGAGDGSQGGSVQSSTSSGSGGSGGVNASGSTSTESGTSATVSGGGVEASASASTGGATATASGGGAEASVSASTDGASAKVSGGSGNKSGGSVKISGGGSTSGNVKVSGGGTSVSVGGGGVSIGD